MLPAENIKEISRKEFKQISNFEIEELLDYCTKNLNWVGLAGELMYIERSRDYIDIIDSGYFSKNLYLNHSLRLIFNKKNNIKNKKGEKING